MYIGERFEIVKYFSVREIVEVFGITENTSELNLEIIRRDTREYTCRYNKYTKINFVIFKQATIYYDVSTDTFRVIFKIIVIIHIIILI